MWHTHIMFGPISICQYQVPLVYIIVLGVPYSGGNAPFNLVRPKPGPIFPSTGFKPGFKPFLLAAPPANACTTDANCFLIRNNYLPWSAGNNNIVRYFFIPAMVVWRGCTTEIPQQIRYVASRRVRVQVSGDLLRQFVLQFIQGLHTTAKRHMPCLSRVCRYNSITSYNFVNVYLRTLTPF